MNDEKERRYSLRDRWQDYQPTKKSAFWAIAGAVLLTMILGFNVAGWTTASKAEAMVEQAIQQGRIELAALVCVQRVMADEGAEAVLADISGVTSSLRRRQVVESGEWAKFTSDARTDRQAAALCAEALYEKAQQRPADTDPVIETIY